MFRLRTAAKASLKILTAKNTPNALPCELCLSGGYKFIKSAFHRMYFPKSYFLNFKRFVPASGEPDRSLKLGFDSDLGRNYYCSSSLGTAPRGTKPNRLPCIGY